jgi:hypothetical protein
LAENGIVLGSSQDGGFIFRNKKEHFKAETFLKLPGKNSNLSTAITNILQQKTVNVFFKEASRH